MDILSVVIAVKEKYCGGWNVVMVLVRVVTTLLVVVVLQYVSELVLVIVVTTLLVVVVLQYVSEH